MKITDSERLVWVMWNGLPESIDDAWTENREYERAYRRKIDVAILAERAGKKRK